MRPKRDGPRRHGRDGRRRRADVQHLDRGGARRRGGRRGRGEARQPRGLVGVGLGGRARGARLPARAGAAADRALDRRARLRLPLRADAPPGDAPRGPGAAGAGDAHGVQRPRPADEPGGRAGAGRRRLRSRAGGDDRLRARHASAPAAPSSSTAPAGSTSSRRPARTSSARSSDGDVDAPRDRPCRTSASRAAPSADLAGGTPEENAAVVREIFAGAPGPKREAVLLNAAGAIAAGGHAADLEEGYRLAAEAVDSGAAAERLEALVAFSQPGGARLMGRFRDSLARAGPPRHRRGEASLAVRRRPAAGRRPARARALRSPRAARPPSRSSSTSASAARSTTSRPRGPRPTSRSSPRASSTTRATCSRPASPAPTPPCSCSATSTTSRRDSCSTGGRTLGPRPARRGARRRRAASVPSRSAQRSSASTRATLRRSTIDRQRPAGARREGAARSGDRRRERHRKPRAGRRGGARGGGRDPRRLDPHARGRSRGPSSPSSSPGPS